MVWFALQVAVHLCRGICLRKGDSLGCVFKPQASFRGNREWPQTSNKTPQGKKFHMHFSRACSSCSPQAKVHPLLVSTGL